jgi:hypothetical protein
MAIAPPIEIDPNLAALAEEAGVPNWDGYGAPPLGREVFAVASRFLESLPADLPPVEVGASAAGDISLEWARSAAKVVSIGISPEGELHYASLDGNRRAYGSMPVTDQLDPELLLLIRRVIG